jgi:hypothetical protein
VLLDVAVEVGQGESAIVGDRLDPARPRSPGSAPLVPDLARSCEVGARIQAPFSDVAAQQASRETVSTAVPSRNPQSPGRRRLPTKRQRRSLRVFLSYRREDASGHAGRLYDLLAARYGAERVFMDIDAIPLGSEFAETINRAVASCDVVIALMGRGWLEAKDSDGHRRLDDPDDFVRREIESALAQGVVVVPATVQGAELPRAEELPSSIAALTRRQGFQLSDTGWRDDVGRLIRRLEEVAEEQADPAAAADRLAPSRRPRPTRRTVAAVLLGSVALVAALAGVLLFRGGDNGAPQGAADGGTQSSGVGTVTLGSNLRISPTKERWYCSGGSEAPPCSFVLTRLPEVDRTVTAPFDGVVTSWQVAGAGGPIRLIVARGAVKPRGRSNLVRVQGSDEEVVRSRGRQQFQTRLKISKGDVVGLQFSVGAYGSAPYSEGTSLQLWIPPLTTVPQLSESTYDYELLYNASIEPDTDRDGFGDVTQDNCPEDPARQKDC